MFTGGKWGMVRVTFYSCVWILMETTKISKTTKTKGHKVRYELSSAKWAGTFRVTLHYKYIIINNLILFTGVFFKIITSFYTNFICINTFLSEYLSQGYAGRRRDWTPLSGGY